MRPPASRRTSSSCGRCGTRCGSACCARVTSSRRSRTSWRELAINPNTVLKAYRELEHDGLVAARPGVGTFVTRTLTDATLAAHGPLRKDLERWLTKARLAGLDDESIEALFIDHLSGRLTAGRSMTAVLQARGLGQELRAQARRCRTARSTSRPGGSSASSAPTAPGKTHAAQPGRRPADADRRARSRCSATAPAGRGSCAKVGFVAQDTPTYAGLSVDDHLRLGAQLNPGWDDALARGPDRAARPRPRAARRASSPAASARSSRSRSGSPSGPSC